MASTSSKVWLTLAAAIGTLVIAGMVVTAPSVQRCQGQDEGIWACLRGDLIEFGLLPDETSPLDAPAIVAGQPTADDFATPAAAASSPPPATEAPAPPVAPELSQPAEPAVAEQAPAPPLAADEAESPVAVADLPQEPPVTTPEPAPATVSDPLPAALDPAAASMPDSVPEPPSMPVATVEAVPEPAAPPQDETASPPPLPVLQPQAVADGATGIAAAATVTPAPTLARLSAALAPVVGIRVALLAESLRLVPPASALSPPDLPVPATAAPDLTQPVDAAAPDGSSAPSAEPASPAGPVETAPALPVVTSPPPAPAADPPATEPIAAAPAEPALPAPPTLTATAIASVSPGASATIAPTIDAIEIDGSSRFIAGAGTDGSTVDLYVGQRYIGSAEVEGGRWVFEARGAITGDLRVALAPGAQGRAAPGTGTTLAFNVAPTGVRLVGKQAAAELLPAQPESELELTPASPALQAFVSVDPELLRFRSGKAIIRRGDTLWAIARRVYGRGALYPRIFEANRDLVRRPGRIYPGQVLTLPQAD